MLAVRAAPLVGLLAAWPIAARLIDRGLPAGIVTVGLVLGAVNVLPALGIALLYRVTGIVNLAQGQIGTVGVLVALAVHNRWNLPWLPSVTAGVAVAAAVGAAAHLTILRRLRHATTTVSVIATVGIAELTGGFSRLVGPELTKPNDAALHGPVGGRWSLFPAVLTGDHVLAVVVAASCTAGIALALTRTRTGRAVRSVASNRERAAGLGVPVDSLLTGVWATAGALSAVGLLLLAALFGLTGTAAVVGGGTAMLLRALAAAAIGRMSLPATAFAAVALGLVEQTATWATGDATLADLVLVGAIVLGLLLPGRAIAEARDTAAGAAVLELHDSTRFALGVGGLAAGLGFALLAPPDKLVGGGTVLVFAMVAVSVVVVCGWAGHLSLGQFGVAGLGGAVASVALGRYGLDVFVALVAGALAGAAVMVVLGLPAARVRGPALTLTSLAFAVAAASYLLQSRHVPWLVETEVSAPSLWGRFSLRDDRTMFLFCLAALVVVVAAVARLERGRFVRVAVAVRDNPAATAMAAVSVARARLTSFAVAGAIAGVAGAVAVVHEQGMQPDAFSPAASVTVVAIAAIGGLGSLPGAVIGAVALKSLDLLLPGAWSALATGTGVVAFLLWFPNGIGELLLRGERAWLARARRHAVVTEVVTQ